MRELIIFGRSPFINEIEIERLIHHPVKTAGFNNFGCQYPVDYHFSFDRFYSGSLAGEYFYPSWHLGHKGTPIVPKSGWPLFKKQHQHGKLCLGFKYFSTSLAVNWAILEGFTDIYLVGIDHVETDRRFEHHDGQVADSQLTPEAHRALKEFVYRCATRARIYQCNPAVRDDWKLPYKDVRELYGPQVTTAN